MFRKQLLNLMITILLGVVFFRDVAAVTVVLSKPIFLQRDVISQLNEAHLLKNKNAWKLIVFGFSHCKDVCPISLANLSRLLKAAHQERIALDGIFITVDPDRDSATALTKYIQNFDENIGFLRFEGEELEKFKAIFGVEAIFYTKNEGNQVNYQVDHSTSAFLIDPQGRIRVMFDALRDADNIIKLFSNNKALFLP